MRGTLTERRWADFGGAENTAPVGNFTTPPYSYTLLDTSDVRATVEANAGQLLDF